MPLYEYVCSTCRHKFEKLSPMASSNDGAPCPQCGERSPRALSVFTAFSRSGEGEMPAMVGGGGGCACGMGGGG